MLQISSSHLDMLVQEFHYAAAQMRLAELPGDKLYFFSASWGMLHRLFNIDYDPGLVFAHQVLVQAHNEIAGRLAAAVPQASIFVIPSEVFQTLAACLDEMAGRWEASRDIDDVLKVVAVIGYSCSGNGAYLWKKGMLRFQ